MADSQWLPKTPPEGERWRRYDARETAPSLVQPGDTLLVGVEGKVTEPIYFNALRRRFSPAIVRFLVVPTHGGSPSDVVQKVIQARDRAQRKEHDHLGYAEVAKFDHCWAVFDTDRAKEENSLEPAMRLAQTEEIHVAHSTPCFEFWLFLHFKYATPCLRDCSAAAALLERETERSYSKSKSETEKLVTQLVPKVAEAVKNARRVRTHHAEAGTKPPCNPSTEVDLLVAALNAAAPRHNRIVGI